MLTNLEALNRNCQLLMEEVEVSYIFSHMEDLKNDCLDAASATVLFCQAYQGSTLRVASRKSRFLYFLVASVIIVKIQCECDP